MQVTIFILFLLVNSVSLRIPLPQSHIVISHVGSYFEPNDDVEWLDDILVGSLTECIHRCNENHLCRVFDYNPDLHQCRLFQLEPSPDEIRYDSSLQSRLGYVELLPELFSAYNQTCNYCENERYLICVDGFCQCPWNTFWDGSLCQKQRFAGSFCSSSEQCRTDTYNLTCVPAKICSSTGYPTNLCGVNQNIVLFNYSASGAQSYTWHTFNITAPATSMTITFSLSSLSSNTYWLLDNISLIDVESKEELIENGDFETGHLTPWNYCNPKATNSSSTIGQNGTFLSQSGQFFYYGGPQPYPDFLSQTIPTSIEGVYQLSFWLSQKSHGSALQGNLIVTVFF